MLGAGPATTDGSGKGAFPGGLLLNLNAAAAPAAISGATLQIAQANSTTNLIQLDSFGSTNQLIFRRAQGTNASPTATASGTTIGLWGARGYTGSAYTSAANAASVGLLAAETWSGVANGTLISFQTTPIGSVTPGEILRINGAAAVLFSNTALPAGGTTGAGFIFNGTGPGIYAGSGAPSLTAAQGSLYLRSDGSSAITRAYINTDGGTTWTPISTVG